MMEQMPTSKKILTKAKYNWVFASLTFHCSDESLANSKRAGNKQILHWHEADAIVIAGDIMVRARFLCPGPRHILVLSIFHWISCSALSIMKKILQRDAHSKGWMLHGRVSNI